MSKDRLAAAVVVAVTVLMIAASVFDGVVFYRQNRHYDVPVWLISIFTASTSAAVYWVFKKK